MSLNYTHNVTGRTKRSQAKKDEKNMALFQHQSVGS